MGASSNDKCEFSSLWNAKGWIAIAYYQRRKDSLGLYTSATCKYKFAGWMTLNPDFKLTPLFDIEYIGNSTRETLLERNNVHISHNFRETWQNFQPHGASRDLCDSWACKYRISHCSPHGISPSYALKSDWSCVPAFYMMLSATAKFLLIIIIPRRATCSFPLITDNLTKIASSPSVTHWSDYVQRTVTFGSLGDRDYWPSCGMVTAWLPWQLPRRRWSRRSCVEQYKSDGAVT